MVSLSGLRDESITRSQINAKFPVRRETRNSNLSTQYCCMNMTDGRVNL